MGPEYLGRPLYRLAYLVPSSIVISISELYEWSFPCDRELFIAETQETVKAHPRFILFATQNPPGHYGGRKVRQL